VRNSDPTVSPDLGSPARRPGTGHEARPAVSDLAGADAMSPAIRAAVRSLKVDRVTAETVPRLREAGITSILLKGASHARWLYDRPDERTYGDCDLLVSTADVDRAEAVLADAGFSRRGFESFAGDRPRYGFPLYRGDNVSIDLHTTFIGIGVPPQRAWAVLSARVEQQTVAGQGVSVLEPIARGLVLVLHAAKDGGKREGRGSKAIRDLELAVERVPIEDWRRVAELAHELDAEAAFAAGLRRIEAGAALADELQLSDRVSAEVALRHEQPPPLAVGVDWLLYGEPGARGVRVAVRKVFPPPSHMRAWSPMARRGRLGLALAYVARPFWVAWKAIPAIRAVRKARRVAGE
jgi:hypothetical protein